MKRCFPILLLLFPNVLIAQTTNPLTETTVLEIGNLAIDDPIQLEWELIRADTFELVGVLGPFTHYEPRSVGETEYAGQYNAISFLTWPKGRVDVATNTWYGQKPHSYLSAGDWIRTRCVIYDSDFWFNDVPNLKCGRFEKLNPSEVDEYETMEVVVPSESYEPSSGVGEFYRYRDDYRAPILDLDGDTLGYDATTRIWDRLSISVDDGGSTWRVLPSGEEGWVGVEIESGRKWARVQIEIFDAKLDTDDTEPFMSYYPLQEIEGRGVYDDSFFIEFPERSFGRAVWRGNGWEINGSLYGDETPLEHYKPILEEFRASEEAMKGFYLPLADEVGDIGSHGDRVVGVVGEHPTVMQRLYFGCPAEVGDPVIFLSAVLSSSGMDGRISFVNGKGKTDWEYWDYQGMEDRYPQYVRWSDYHWMPTGQVRSFLDAALSQLSQTGEARVRFEFRVRDISSPWSDRLKTESWEFDLAGLDTALSRLVCFRPTVNIR